MENYILLGEYEIKNWKEFFRTIFSEFFFFLVFFSFSTPQRIRISNMVKAKFTTNQLFPNFIISSRLY